jgi:hypothetical protein
MQDAETFERLNSYFNAIENDKVIEYHKKRGRK